MQSHSLMQAIARVNRVLRDKPAGLIVDYIGIAQNLKSVLGHYSKPDQKAPIQVSKQAGPVQELAKMTRQEIKAAHRIGPCCSLLGSRPDADREP